MCDDIYEVDVPGYLVTIVNVKEQSKSKRGRGCGEGDVPLTEVEPWTDCVGGQVCGDEASCVADRSLFKHPLVLPPCE